MDDVRKAFAAANKVSPSLFSFNSEGACENCQGLGVIYTEIPRYGRGQVALRDLRRQAL